MDFTGKVVIVTGASSGIGEATAKLLASHNAVLTLVGRDEERLRQVTEFCAAARGITPLTVKVDLTHPGSCEEVVNRTVGTFGKIDVLVNCAGKIVLSSLFDDNIDLFDDLFNSNLRVPYKLTQLSLPHLIKTKGNVVNIRGAQKLARHGFLNFSIMNAALEKFTQAGAVDVAASGVRINAVSIALTNTSVLKNVNFDDDEKDFVHNMIKTNYNITVLQPEEVAKMVMFVASGICPSLNGANIYLDAGANFKF